MKQKNLILMVVAIGCGLVAAFLTTQINARGPKVEQVEVIVAAKDLAVGTMFTKSEMPKLITKKMVPKDSLPPIFINDENELLDKRLSAPVQAEQIFDPKYLSTRGVIILPDGMDMVSLPMNIVHAAAGFVGPGSHVDILASLHLKNRLIAFPLLIDMQILAVDTKTQYDEKGAFKSLSSVSLAVTQEQALLLALAKERGCKMELLLRHPSKPVDPTYDIKKVLKLMQDVDTSSNLTSSESNQRGIHNDATTPADVPPINPNLITPEPAKGTMVKVLKATVEIDANTEITKDLIAQSFKEQEIPKEIAESLGAYSDLTSVLGQVFHTPVQKGQLILKGMIGLQKSKVAPPEASDPKPDPVAEPVKKRIHDLAVHTSNGTQVFRYEEVTPGEWRLKRVMSPEEANRDLKSTDEPSAPLAPRPAPESQTPAPGTRKVD